MIPSQKCMLALLAGAVLFMSACSGVHGTSGGGFGGGSSGGSGGSGGNGGGGGTTSGPFTIGGSVVGLTGTGLVLNNNSTEDLTITGTGSTISFTFKNTVASGAGYNVIVKTQPTNPSQTCSVSNGIGTATANVTNVSVVCTQVFTVGGTISGLLGSGMVLQNNGGDNLKITGTGTVNFTFATPMLANAAYAVTILTQPSLPGQTCALTNASGTVNGNVSTVLISCPVPKFSVGGYVTGLVVGPGDTIEIQNNVGDNLFVTGDVPFTFPTQFSYGTTYSVTAFTWQPASQPGIPCNIFNATEIVTGNISDVIVDCQHNDWAWWFSGPNAPAALNQYGTASGLAYTSGQPSLPPPYTSVNGNTPGSRDFPMAWTDNFGMRWLFGGYGYEVTHPTTDGIPGLLNDMWAWTGYYDPGGWVPADIGITVDTSGLTTVYAADITSLQRKWDPGTVPTILGTGTACGVKVFTCTRPDSRWGGVTWTDAAGNLWMFGGQGTPQGVGLHNDIWEFDAPNCKFDVGIGSTGTGIFTGCKWTWQGGPLAYDQPTTSSFPGARWGAASYTDAAGNLWMFGGQGIDSAGNLGLLNDLWKYNIAAQTWTLVSGGTGGSVTGDLNGVYGTQGTGAAANLPGSRQTAVLWTDPAGIVWLFGGFGLDSKGTSGTGSAPGGGLLQIGSVLNDLWKYDPSTGFWTWVSGSNVANKNGVYGMQAISNATLNEAATSIPGARWGSMGWVSPDNGNLFLFGGFGYGSDSTKPTGFLNDVWEFDRTTGQWIWWKGSIDVDQPGTYITTPFNYFELSYVNNAVGARRGAALWAPDSLGYVFMFGGQGYAAKGGPYGELNDMWRYLPFP